MNKTSLPSKFVYQERKQVSSPQGKQATKNFNAMKRTLGLKGKVEPGTLIKKINT